MVIVLYILVCVLYGIFAVGMARKLYSPPIYILLLNFVINVVLCPMSLIWAIYCIFTGRGWASGMKTLNYGAE